MACKNTGECIIAGAFTAGLALILGTVVYYVALPMIEALGLGPWLTSLLRTSLVFLVVSPLLIWIEKSFHKISCEDHGKDPTRWMGMLGYLLGTVIALLTTVANTKLHTEESAMRIGAMILLAPPAAKLGLWLASVFATQRGGRQEISS